MTRRAALIERRIAWNTGGQTVEQFRAWREKYFPEFDARGRDG